ncbi:hypothetical protein HYT26_02535 [Candidatus Pacearchaeota archaeon]|nr:hypothetical protein [Candidatus Pacearchaeota archaeon]
MKRIFGIAVLLLIAVAMATFVFAHENFTETKQLIDSNISCSELSNGQLEEMGDYYMEQMHPGEAHELMHSMMGGEDSATTKAMHIQMAKAIYCGETNSGMMSMMNMMAGTQSASGYGGMMSMMYGNGMMGYGTGTAVLGWIVYLLVIALIIAAIYWLIKTANRKR